MPCLALCTFRKAVYSVLQFIYGVQVYLRLILIVDSSDNCIIIANANQRNSDSDTFGNECDNCPYIGNQNQRDSDEDGVGDVCDNCLLTPNPDQENDDDDQQGDACDNDYDNDGFGTKFQNFS